LMILALTALFFVIFSDELTVTTVYGVLFGALILAALAGALRMSARWHYWRSENHDLPKTESQKNLDELNTFVENAKDKNTIAK
jgi:hypothetical protein